MRNLRPCPGVRKDYGVLEGLFERGADVNAQDKSGTSVSRVAYACLSPFCLMGSYPGDLWDSFLQSRGYDIEKYRGGNYRKAQYTEDYTRAHFEMLWEGKEHLCPYWDDEPWPPKAEGYSSADDLEYDGDCSSSHCSESDGGDEGSFLAEETKEKGGSYLEEGGRSVNYFEYDSDELEEDGEGSF